MTQSASSRWPTLARRSVLGLVLLVALGAAAEPPAPPLALERTLPLPGVSGRIDHLVADPEGRRAFVAEVGAGALEAIDLQTGQRLARVTGLKEPQGVAYLPALGEVAVASGGDGTVRFYRADGLQPAGLVQLSGDADNLRLDPQTGLLVAADGRGLALIDAARRRLVGEIAVGAHPEGFQLDPARRVAIANVPDQRRIVVADLPGLKLIASWPLGGGFWNFPLALSPAGVVAVAMRGPPTLLVVDGRTGATLSRLKTCGDSDDLFFDPRRPRLYVSCGDGHVETFESGQGAWRSLGLTVTGAGARTSLFVASLDRLIVVRRASLAAPAALLVMRPQG